MSTLLSTAGVINLNETSLFDLIKEDSPWAYWTLEEGEGSMLDHSGNGYHLEDFVVTGTGSGSGIILRNQPPIITTNKSVYIDGYYIGSDSYNNDLASEFNGNKPLSILLTVKPEIFSGYLIHLGDFNVFGHQGLTIILEQSESSFRIKIEMFYAGYWYSQITPYIPTANAPIIQIGFCKIPDVGSFITINGNKIKDGADINVPMMFGTSSKIAVGNVIPAGSTTRIKGNMQHVAVFNKIIPETRFLEYARTSKLY